MINSCTFGILVEPPTKTISSTLAFAISESLITLSTGFIVSLKKSKHNSSNLDLVKVIDKSSPSANESISIVVCWDEDKVLFALSHYVLNLLNAFWLSLIEILHFLSNCCTH